MAPARRRAPARNGASSAKGPDETATATATETTTETPEATEVSLPRRAAATRKKQQPQQPASRSSRGKKATAEPEPESDAEEQVEDDEQGAEEDNAEAPEAEDKQGKDDKQPAAEPPAAEEGSLVRLRFSEPLSWRPGKPIPTEELIRRLRALNQELSDLEQETFDTESLTKVAKELASHNILNHKDKGVKAFAAVCLVDILCLCAPNAPFTQTQLKVSRAVPAFLSRCPANRDLQCNIC